MKKEFYIGQPLIDKETGERMVLYYNDGECIAPYNVLGDSGEHCRDYHDLEPSTEFKLSEIIAGLEQGYFDVGTEFEIKGSPEFRIEVSGGMYGPFLAGLLYEPEANINSRRINSTWQLVEPRKEMTLEEIEAELGYKVKLKDNGENLNRESSPD